MDRTASTESRCLYKGALYITLIIFYMFLIVQQEMYTLFNLLSFVEVVYVKNVKI